MEVAVKNQSGIIIYGPALEFGSNNFVREDNSTPTCESALSPPTWFTAGNSAGPQKLPQGQFLFLVGVPGTPHSNKLCAGQVELRDGQPFSLSGQGESNARYTHPKGTDYHYPMAR